MTETKRHLSWCVLAIVCFAACGGDDDSSNGVSTGLPADKTLSNLTEAEIKNACQSVNNTVNAIFTPTALARATCVPIAAQTAVTYANGKATFDVNKCQEVVDSCVKSATQNTDETVGESDELDCQEATASGFAGCEATVGDYESCMNVVLNKMQHLLNALTCQNAENLDEETYANDLDFEQVPECKTIRTKCPNAELGIPFED